MAATLPSAHEIFEAPEIQDTRHPVARLAALHAEAEETSRLANLLGRSIHAAIALPVLAGVTLALGSAGLAEGLTWMGFILAASGAIFLAWRRTIAQPFERAALKSFSQDLDAILVFAGFAWGAGAFLGLSSGANVGVVVLFAAGAGAILTVLLRERMSVFLFLAPVAALASFACVLRPLAGGALDAAFVLIASAAVAASTHFADRRGSGARDIADLAGLPYA